MCRRPATTSSTGSLPSFRALNWWPGACRWRPSRWRTQGEGVCFNVYVYNVQPGITIDYATGASSLEGDALPEDSTQKEPEDTLYILNTSSGKFHLPSCSGAASMKEENRQAFSGSREELIAQGYSPCGQCKP